MPKAVGFALLGGWLLASSGLLSGILSDRYHRAAAIALILTFGLAYAVRPASSRFLRALTIPRTRWFLVGMTLAATGLTVFAQQVALRGQVVALDSSVYLMEARALSHFALGTPVPEPHLPFSGRFLFEGPDGRMYGVFPPGFPLFLAPFVKLGAPLLAGPVTAALLVVAQYVLGRSMTRDEAAIRLSIVMTLPSFARAFETADLLSHAFVAVLSSLAVAAALRLGRVPRAWMAAGMGAAVGWVFSARLLDGLVLGGVVSAVTLYLAWKRRVPAKLLVIAAVCALPFVGLLAAHQHAATGSYTTPTQSAYFVRSDWPPTCHRLGFGKDVGCSVEHPDDRAAFGKDGYDLSDALRVVRSRAEALGADLFGAGAVALLGFALIVRRRAPSYAVVGAYVVGLTLLYGLFYYGNAPGFGARHLFPVAPFLYLLVARGVTTLGSGTEAASLSRMRGAVALGILGVALLGHFERWRRAARDLSAVQAERGDLRRAAEAQGITRGLVLTSDMYQYLAAFDPVLDGPDRVLAVNDGAGAVELRRAHPGIPTYVFSQGSLRPVELPPPAPGLSIELESAWPSFVRPDGLGAKTADAKKEVSLPASGGWLLVLFESKPGATLRVPFWVTTGGRFRLKVQGVTTVNSGNYELAVDGVPFATWKGFSPRSQLASTEPSEPITLTAGKHELVARCLDKAPESRGHLAAFDVLTGEPADLPRSGALTAFPSRARSSRTR